ncbi:hypothetical protein Naga_100172g2 [Nannochloropsis gaditana]|uniref:Secreted protein n=1 Tax=Nannochloropsis gaditana TaxID=72520 RepID=W7T1P6_9STRA|nr:hypothetical protein Naga_100172g2 [Nannochloropsis gaditana]
MYTRKFHRSLFSRALVDFLILPACRPVASGEQSIQNGGRCLPTGRSQCGLRQASEQATKGGDGEGSGGNCKGSRADHRCPPTGQVRSIRRNRMIGPSTFLIPTLSQASERRNA